MDRLLQDTRLALRGLRRAPTFTATSIAILSLGIGMAIAMVTVFNAVLLRRLPVQEQDRVVVMWTYRDPGVEFGTLRRDVDELRRVSRTMRDVGAVAHWGAAPAPLIDGDRSLLMNRAVVSANFFDVLGALPILGRLLRPDDELVGAKPTVVLSYTSWQREFGGDSSIIGRELLEPYSQWRLEIIGIAPPGLDYPAGAGYWVCWQNPGSMAVTAIARLAPNASAEMARAEYFSVVRRQAPERALVGAHVFTLSQAMLGDVRPVLIVMTSAVALLLLIACVNVGNLLLLRATSRIRELAVRRALGATYADVLQQLLAETGCLATAGGALGLICSALLLRMLVAFAPTKLPRLDVIELAGTPITAGIAVTLLAVLLFGVGPALLAARGNMAEPLRLDTRSGTETKRRRSVRQILVATQVALALTLLAGAGLLTRSLVQLQRVDLGYTPDQLFMFSFSWPATRYDSIPKKLFPIGEQLMTRLGAIPGVRSATPLLLPPFYGANVFVSRLDVEGQTSSEAEANPVVPAEAGGPEYFRTLGIPLLRGRGFLDSDTEDAAPIAIVSEAVAKRLWPNEDPVGKRIKFFGPGPAWRTVVGVAGDIHYRALREGNPTVYLPWRQSYWQASFAIRAVADPASLIPAVRRELAAVDPQLNLWSAQTMDEMLAAPLSQPRMNATLLSAFGLVALLLAAIGLYGVMASLVREQTRELGIRMALGATRERVRVAVLRRALLLTIAGTLVGLVTAILSSQLLQKLLFQVSPADPTALIGASVLLLAVALGAAYLPARRATQIDPVKALRAE